MRASPHLASSGPRSSIDASSSAHRLYSGSGCSEFLVSTSMAPPSVLRTPRPMERNTASMCLTSPQSGGFSMVVEPPARRAAAIAARHALELAGADTAPSRPATPRTHTCTGVPSEALGCLPSYIFVFCIGPNSPPSRHLPRQLLWRLR